MDTKKFYGWYIGQDAYEVYHKYFEPAGYHIVPCHGSHNKDRKDNQYETEYIRHCNSFNWTLVNLDKGICASYFSKRGRRYSIEEIQKHFGKINTLITYY